MRADAGQRTSYKVGDVIWVAAHARVGKTAVRNIMVRTTSTPRAAAVVLLEVSLGEKSPWRRHDSEGTFAVLFVHGSVVF